MINMTWVTIVNPPSIKQFSGLTQQLEYSAPLEESSCSSPWWSSVKNVPAYPNPSQGITVTILSSFSSILAIKQKMGNWISEVYLSLKRNKERSTVGMGIKWQRNQIAILEEEKLKWRWITDLIDHWSAFSPIHKRSSSKNRLVLYLVPHNQS